jgi:hypothetical protein
VPSSLASALTRTFATFLLVAVRAPVDAGRPGPYFWGRLIAEFSSGAHQLSNPLSVPSHGRFPCASGGSFSVPCGWPLASASRWATSAAGSGAALVRSARPNARRRRACSRHSPVGCSQAPRPGRRCRGSGLSRIAPVSPVSATTRRRADQLSVLRQPTHVRVGSPELARVASGRSPVRSASTSLSLLAAGSAIRARGGVRTDVDPPARELGREPGVLALLADGQGQLVVRHDHACRAQLRVDDLHRLHA